MRSRKGLWIGASITLAFVSLAGAADVRAQDMSATALALFEEGRHLMDAGKLDEACPKFAASLKLVPKTSTELNLADCYERSGKIASAWARFQEAAGMATREGQTDRARLARSRAAALEPRLPKMTIQITGGASNVVVKRDGESLDPAVLGTAVPVDPGKHTIQAETPGKPPYTTTVDVAEKASVTVTIPALVDSTPAVSPVPAPAPAPAPAATTPPPSEPPPASAPPPAAPADDTSSSPSSSSASPGSGQRTLGLVIGGVGIAGLATGGIFALLANSAKSDYQQHCGSNIGAPATACDPQGISGHQDASTKATVSTIAFAVGGAALAAGVLLFFTAPHGDSAPQVGIGPGGIVVRGGF
jgi:hypothetical protein